MIDETREALAAQQHDIWSSWMRWMFTIGEFHGDGTWTMPAALVARWRRQMETPYDQLPENEKHSDRVRADKILEVLNGQ